MRYTLEHQHTAADRALAEHLARCGACSAEVDRLLADAALLRAHAAPAGARTAACLDDDTVAALAAGDLRADERAPLVAHLASCASCRGRVASVARALADPAVAREVAAADAAGARRRGSYRILLPAGLAAAAALLFVVLPGPRDDGESPHRAPTITAARAPVPTSPVGAVAAAESLRWASVAGSDRYRVTLFAADGRVLYETQLTDTVVTLPDSVHLVPGRSYLWKVEARTGWDRWATSELVEFTIARGPSR